MTAAALALSLLLLPWRAQAASETAEPPRPRYELELSMVEFSMLHSAAAVGVGTYGGDAEFRVRMAKAGENVVWHVEIEQERLLEVWRYWMAEKTSTLVDRLDLDELSAGDREALRVCQKVNAKIQAALASPIWPRARAAGVVQRKEEGFELTGDERWRLVAGQGVALDRWIDEEVLIEGFTSETGTLEVTRCILRKPNTLELVVMSHCPFARAAERSIVQRLLALGDDAPVLEVHYLFYEKEEEGTRVFASMHGDEEIEENLVQMTLRDFYSRDVFLQYLLARSSSQESWSKLLVDLGMGPSDVASIKEHLETEREAIIGREYDYVAGALGIRDGSPTYLWESEQVPDLSAVPRMEGLVVNGQACQADG